jgi:hypothetical protein
MSEVSDLLHQARAVAETAKDAMGHSLAADKTTQSLAHTILEEAKRLLPGHRIIASLNLPQDDVDWVSVRSAMEAVANALSAENVRRSTAASLQRTPGSGSGWS